MIYFAAIHLGFFRVTGEPAHHCAYLPQFDRELFLVKIGKADRPGRRASGLASMLGRPVTILAAIPGGLAEEAELHRRFAHLRLPGIGRNPPEWFHPTAELMAFIEAARPAHGGPYADPEPPPGPPVQKNFAFTVD